MRSKTKHTISDKWVIVWVLVMMGVWLLGGIIGWLVVTHL